MSKRNIDILDKANGSLFEQNYLKTRTPVVLRRMLDGWKPRTDWNFSYLQQVAGHHEVPVGIDSKYTADATLKTMPLRDLLTRIQEENADEILYLRQCSIEKTLPELWREIGYLNYLATGSEKEFNLWVGSKGTLTPLHYDLSPNFLIQLQGEKKLTFFPPSETPRLYPHSFRTKYFHLSQVDIEKPDLKKFPNFQAKEAIELTIRAGDMLFIPPFWWHQVRGLSPSISLNVWWSSPHLLDQMRLLLGSRQGIRAIGSTLVQGFFN